MSYLIKLFNMIVQCWIVKPFRWDKYCHLYLYFIVLYNHIILIVMTTNTKTVVH